MAVGIVVGVAKSGGFVSGVVVLVFVVVLFKGFSRPGDDGVDGGFSLCGDSGSWL